MLEGEVPLRQWHFAKLYACKDCR